MEASLSSPTQPAAPKAPNSWRLGNALGPEHGTGEGQGHSRAALKPLPGYRTDHPGHDVFSMTSRVKHCFGHTGRAGQCWLEVGRNQTLPSLVRTASSQGPVPTLMCGLGHVHTGLTAEAEKAPTLVQQFSPQRQTRKASITINHTL